jgi:hypothetical protein
LLIVEQSSSFSYIPARFARSGNLAKRVPPVPTPQDGIATRKPASLFDDRVNVDATTTQLPAKVIEVLGLRSRT